MIDTGLLQSRPVQILLILAAFVVVVAGMRAAESILVPFFLAAFLAIVFSPALNWLIAKKIPTVLSLVIVIVAILIIGMIVAAVVGSSITDFMDNLPMYQQRLQTMSGSFITWFEKHGAKFSDESLVDSFNLGSVMNMVGKLLSGLGNMVANAFLIILTVIFLLLEASFLPEKLKAAFGDPDSGFPRIKEWIDSVKRYMFIKTWISLLTGISVGLLLWIIGVDFPILWGMLAFILNFVPNIGSIIAAVPAVLLAFVQLGFIEAVLAAAVFILVNTVYGNIVEPKFMGKGLGLSTLVVFISLVFWGWVLGPVGMLLSVPLTVTVKIALHASDETRWIAILLGPEIEPSG